MIFKATFKIKLYIYAQGKQPPSPNENFWVSTW